MISVSTNPRFVRQMDSTRILCKEYQQRLMRVRKDRYYEYYIWINWESSQGDTPIIGRVACFNHIKKITSSLSKECDFFQYKYCFIAEPPCKELHGMQVGGKTFNVRHAIHSSRCVCGGADGGSVGVIGPGGGRWNDVNVHGVLVGPGRFWKIAFGVTYDSGASVLARPNENATPNVRF